jgi:O-antigen ligase
MEPTPHAHEVHPVDRAFFRAAVFLLFATLTVSRVKITLLNNPIAPWYQVLLYFDAPVLVILFLNFRRFIIIPLFLCWIFVTTIGRVERPLFFSSTYAQWWLAYLSFLLLPPLLFRFGLIDFAMDVFLGWSLFAAAVHLGMIALNPGDLLDGVTSIFGGNRAHVGMFFLLSFSIGAYSWMERKRRLHLVAMIASILCLMASGSRASQIAVAIFMFLFILTSRSKKLILIGIPTISGLLLFVKLIVANRASDSFALSKGMAIDSSAGNRIIIWFKSWEIITQSKEHFLYGIGFSNFRFLYNKLVTAPFYANAAHNLYLHYWVETGLIGLLLMLAVCGSLIIYCLLSGPRGGNLKYMGFLTVGILFTGFTQETLLPDPSFGNFLTLLFLLFGLTTYKAAAAAAAKPAFPGGGKGEPC